MTGRRQPVAVEPRRRRARRTIDHGHVVIAAITSCTNTSNPSVMIGAGLLAKKAVERGLTRKPWVKTSLAPGSRVVTDYYDRAGLTPYLDKLGFEPGRLRLHHLHRQLRPADPARSADAVTEHDLTVCSVLSGNRNFEGRIHPECKMNFLASPPLVVAYALAGTMHADLLHDRSAPAATASRCTCATSGRRTEEIEEVVDECLQARDVHRTATPTCSPATTTGAAWTSPTGDTFAWDDDSTYVRRPPYFDGMPREPEPVSDITGARVLAMLGDSVTTDHISPAGAIKTDSPAGAT